MRFCTVSLALALRSLFYALTVVPLVEVAKTEWTVVFSMSLQGKKPAARRWFCVCGDFLGQ